MPLLDVMDTQGGYMSYPTNMFRQYFFHEESNIDAMSPFLT